MNTREKRQLNKRFNRLCKRIDRSYDDVIEAFQLQSTCNSDRLYLMNSDDTGLGSVNPETGEIRDILIYFDDYNDIALTYRFLEAYLLTNEDVLDECSIYDLKRLLNRYK